MRKFISTIALGLTVLAPLGAVHADPFTAADVAHWKAEYQSAVKQGRQLWIGSSLGTNGVACVECHPNAANTHPETYPKFQKQLGKVVDQWQMINWCIENPLQGKGLAPDDPRMIALRAYITSERKGVPMDAGKH